MELLLEFLLELGLELLVQILVELGADSVVRSFRRRGHDRPVLALIALVLLGGLLGAAYTWRLPNRLVPNPPLPGLSLVISPLLVGLAMGMLGRWHRRRGGQPSVLASF